MSGLGNLAEKPFDSTPRRDWRGPLVLAAIGLMVGITAGHFIGGLWFWLIGGMFTSIMMLSMAMRRRMRGARCWGWLALVMLGAAWGILQSGYVGASDIQRYLDPEGAGQLAKVSGIVLGPVSPTGAASGPFMRFSYKTPGTVFGLRVESVRKDGRWIAATGNMRVKIRRATDGVVPGSRIVAAGWLSSMHGPSNPGEFDYRQHLWRNQRIAGTLTLDNVGQLHVIHGADAGSASIFAPFTQLWQSVHWRIARAARRSLDWGMTDWAKAEGVQGEATLSMLDSLLLGQNGSRNAQVNQAFSSIGLADLMAISGSHLAILLGLVWLLARIVTAKPARASMAVLIVLALYLLIVPWQVPIIRSAVMAAVFCIGFATSRRTPAIELLALATILVLLWRPDELFVGGFQLSYGIVAGLILFSAPLADRIWPRNVFDLGPPSRRWRVGRWFVDAPAIGCVSFAIAMPIVAYHFRQFHPWAVALELGSLPAFTAVVMAGYVKIALGMIYLPLSTVLVWPTWAAGAALLWLVQWGHDLPSAMWMMPANVSLAWTATMLVVIVIWLAGGFKQRKKALACAAVILASWTWAAGHPDTVAQVADAATGRPRPAMRVAMFAVGNGSCFLVRSGGHSLMFDCGSHSYLGVGEKSIVPTLAYLAVGRIDRLFISHADIDHYCGVLAVADAVGVGKILTTPQLLAEAKARPHSAVGCLVAELRQRDIAIEAIHRGWRGILGKAKLHVLWPPVEFHGRGDNDTSLVVSVRAGGRRLLLNGDIGQAAMEGLFKHETNLRADITGLPHHGSFVPDSPRWLAAVHPSIILQSTGPARLRRDKWKPVLAGMDVRRLISARLGMVRVIVGQDGTMRVMSFLHHR